MIPKKAKVCPHCAAKQKSNPLPLILVAVVLILATASVSILFFHFPFAPPFDVPFGAKNISDSVLGAGMELSKKEEEAVMAVLEECGFTSKIAEVRQLSAGETYTLYAVHDADTIRYLDGDVVVEVNNETKAVRTISYGSRDLYISGHVITPVTDYYLSGPERDVYLAVCLDAVKSRLDVPETAVFPSKSNWKYTMDGNKVTVNSTVSYKDPTGQESTVPFQVDFEDGAFVSFTFLSTAN